ncbi:MAG TPA: hypothetical protein PLV70_04585 [Flavobacteriales bacterium]|nr:hypothetical protein [Flavobacteriales bacterium]HRO39687.1 hypothetical protein [Flavobacteriales bacterium]HRP81936.1 hypothetical protein [Flavobacteriales bacterium]HRQ84370.1 hypothetical protein [Flavobacteriales bacterium]
MRRWFTVSLLANATLALAQGNEPRPALPLVMVEQIALPLSAVQVEQAARQAWPWTFGQEPGAGLVPGEPGTGRIEAVGRFNYRSSALGNRQQTLGVISYHVSIVAGNGSCMVRIYQFSHAGNKNAPGGAVSLGPLYEGNRPAVRVPGVSMAVAGRLHDDMRQQVTAHLRPVIGAFAARLRRAAENR